MATTQTQIDIVLNAINRVNNVVDRVSRQVSALSTAETKANRTGRVLARTQRSVDTAFARTARAAAKLTAGLIAVAAAYAGLRSIDNLLAPSIEMEQFETQFGVLLGSLEEGQKRVAELVDFAAETPFELPGVIRASRTLETLTKGALSTGDGLKLVADVAAATGQPIDEIAVHVGRLYDGLQSGRPVGESAMRLQELGIISGETRNKIEDLQKEGKKGPEVWDELSGSLQRFSGITNALSLTAGVQITNIADNFYKLRTALFSDVRDALTPRLVQLNEQLDKLANSEKIKQIGTNIASIFEMVIDAYQNDQLDDLIVLSLKAAYEQASNFFRKTFSADVDWYAALIKNKALRAFLEAPIDFAFWMRGLANEGGMFFISVWETVTSTLVENVEYYADKLIHTLKQKATDFVNYFIQRLTQQINGVLRVLNLLPGVTVSPFADIKPLEGPGAFEGQIPLAPMEKWVQVSEKNGRELENILQKLEAANGKAKAVLLPQEQNLEVIKEQVSYTEQLSKWYENYVQKIQANKINLEAQKGAIIENAPKPTPGSVSDGKKKDGREVEIKDRFQQLGDDLQVIAQDMSAVMAAPFEGMFYGVSQSIQGLIMQTMTWKDALKSVGSAILGSVVSAIASMAAAWLTSQLMMAIGMQSLATATTTSSAAMGTSLAAAWLPAAISASIATFGGAAAAGSAAFTLAMLSGSASAVLFGGLASAALGGITAASAASRGYATGGLVTGGEQQITINENGQEYVVNHAGTQKHLTLLEMINHGATTTDIITKLVSDNFSHASALDIVNNTATFEPIGRDALPRVRDNATPMNNLRAPSTNATHGSKLNVAIFDRKQQFKEWLRSSEGRRAYIDMARTNKVELGLT